MATRRRVLDPLPLFDEDLVLDEFAQLGIKPQHAFTMWRHLLQRDVSSVRDIPNLPKAAYELIDKHFEVTTSRVVKKTVSSDGSTTKMMVELQDGRLIESVIMRYGAVQLAGFPQQMQRKAKTGDVQFRSKERATLCISSQVGCQMGCTFCATGTMGLVDNLTAGEILEQLYHANKIEQIRNVVFMGMGEPLDNYDAVIAAIRAMTDVRRFSLSPKHISVSTVGVAPRLETLAHDAPGVSLALSLHAPTQDLRGEIVPSAKAWHIDRIMDAMDAFIRVQRERDRADRRKFRKGAGKRGGRKAPAGADAASAPDSPQPVRFVGEAAREDDDDDVSGRAFGGGSGSGSAMSSGRESTISLASQGSYVLVEYVLIAGINDAVEVAHKLGELLIGRPVLLNVIPYNPTEVPYDYRPPSQEATDLFVKTVREHGVWTMLRQELGQDIDSACGQLVVSSLKKKAKTAAAAGGAQAKSEAASTLKPKPLADIEDAVPLRRRRTPMATQPAAPRHRDDRRFQDDSADDDVDDDDDVDNAETSTAKGKPQGKTDQALGSSPPAWLKAVHAAMVVVVLYLFARIATKLLSPQ
eukprot:m.75719 g.75719  ORF g.75719 m.75719 type:complete len:582 (-) comp14490_c0_seq4:147-1892(-)